MNTFNQDIDHRVSAVLACHKRMNGVDLNHLCLFVSAVLLRKVSDYISIHVFCEFKSFC